MASARKLNEMLSKQAVKKTKESVWNGPEKDGITQSLLSRFLVCRERFRLLVVEGLRPADQFNHHMEYGQMWHTCEEVLAGNVMGKVAAGWRPALLAYAQDLCRKYPLQQEQVQHWYNVCKAQFPVYVDYWAKHPDVRRRTPLLQEQVFDVPYALPSGRIVRLRGKWDSVDLIGKGKAAGLYLQENKTKGDINEEQLRKQLASGFDLQTGMYLAAMFHWRGRTPIGMGSLFDLPKKAPHGFGVRYNVVRRPLSGGKHSIRQHQPTKSNPAGESTEDYYARLRGLIAEEPEYYFHRWKVEFTSADLTRFRRECLDPILDQLCDWWEWITHPANAGDPFRSVKGSLSSGSGPHAAPHWRHPYGVWNALNEGGSSEVDEFLNTGSELGLERTDNLFRELSG